MDQEDIDMERLMRGRKSAGRRGAALAASRASLAGGASWRRWSERRGAHLGRTRRDMERTSRAEGKQALTHGRTGLILSVAQAWRGLGTRNGLGGAKARLLDGLGEDGLGLAR